ncbi:MAG: DNA-binding protein WhiA [Selenomonadaceae bacterium]|nr:DNA-binding protein WhiA [Selenomonadaceae bacterium]
MPSYAQDVKNELAHRSEDDEGCLRAEFVALIKVGSKIINGRLEFSGANAAVARRVIKLAKKFLPSTTPMIAAVSRKKRLKYPLYVVKFIMVGEVQNFFNTLDLSEVVKRTRYKIAFLRGAFMARGTVSRPETHYFLTMVLGNEKMAKFIRKLMINLEFGGGIYEVKKKFVIWLRNADSVADFLGMVGANNALERLEVVRNLKEVRIQVNRLVNMETAGLNKAIAAANRQLVDIKFLMKYNVSVNKRLQEAMTLRLENPCATLSELADKIPMTQQGLCYRFKAIHRLVEKTQRILARNNRRAL